MSTNGSASVHFACRRTIRTAVDGARRVMHSLLQSWLPAEYLPREIAAMKQRLDPTGSRQSRVANRATAERIGRLGRLLGMTGRQTEASLDEARRVRLLELPGCQTADLASPMCFEDCCSIYVTTRAIRPKTVIETGVANGVSSAFILAALEANDRGRLLSVELSQDPRIGQVIPTALRERWSMYRGNSLDVLPSVFEEMGACCMFVHDSWHSYRQMREEYELAWPYIRPGGVLCSHDTMTTNAFSRFLRRHRREIQNWIVNVNFGAAQKR